MADHNWLLVRMGGRGSTTIERSASGNGIHIYGTKNWKRYRDELEDECRCFKWRRMGKDNSSVDEVVDMMSQAEMKVMGRID